jgi:hypothetical protein
MKPLAAIVCAVAPAVAGCRGPQTPAPAEQPQTDPMLQQIRRMTARFAPVDLSADISALAPNERQALARLVAAAKVFDALYLRQMWAGNQSLLLTLLRDRSELGQARLHYFLLNKGPWSRLDENAPGQFLSGRRDA